MRGRTTGELVFEDCEVPEENVMGRKTAAWRAHVGLDYERTVLAAGRSGSCRQPGRVLPYVRERKQFGKPIGSFQLMQAKIATCTWL